MIRNHPHLYTVTYRRAGWKQAQSRHFIMRHHARLLVKKLTGDLRPDLAPLTELTVTRRPLGTPETIYTLEDHR